MNLSNLSIRKPVLASMFIATILLFGLVALNRLGIDIFPEVDIPTVTVNTTWEGADPSSVDGSVTDKVEERLTEIEGVKHITSISMEGGSRIIVEFELYRNPEDAAAEVRDKVSEALRDLPTDIDPPVINKLDINARPILWVSLYSDTMSIKDISEYLDYTLRPKIQTVPGVGNIQYGGFRRREMRVYLNAAKLEGYNLTAAEVMDVIRQKNIEAPSGILEGTEREFNVLTEGNLLTEEAFNGLILAYRNGAPIRLRDIGYAKDWMELDRTRARYNEIPCVSFGVAKRTGANAFQVAEAVKERLDQIEPTLPKGMKMAIAYDGSDFIKQTVDSAKEELLFGSIFAALIVWLFLQSLNPSVITALAIPTSFIGAFALMYFLGFTLNNMTMLAMTVLTGIVIDDAIIVLENIYRHMEEGKDRQTASILGASEITGAATATTLAIAGMFLPVAFMGGLIGKFFYQFGIIVAGAILLSLFVALTLVPMLCSRYLKTGRSTNVIFRGFERVNGTLEHLYRKTLPFSLNHRFLVVTVAIVSCVSSFFLIKFIGQEFTPKQDLARFIIRTKGPLGSSIEYMDAKHKILEKIVQETPETLKYISIVGLGQVRGARDVSKGFIFVTLKEKGDRNRSQQAIMTGLRKKFAQIPGIQAFLEDPETIPTGASTGDRRTPLQFDIKGDNIYKLAQVAQKTVDYTKTLPGVVDVDDSAELRKPELHLEIDRDKAADLDIDIDAITQNVYALIGGARLVTSKFEDPENGRRYDIRVRFDDDSRLNPDIINHILVANRRGERYRLASIVKLIETVGPNTITRRDREKAITVYGDVVEGASVETSLEKSMAYARSILPDPSYSVAPAGQAETMKESFMYLIFALWMAITISYIILAGQYDHFLHPLTILSALPLSTIGAFVALLIFGQTLNIMSMIGMILLLGVVKKNSILMVDFTNQLRDQGKGRNEALLQACPLRLRPILMTAFSTIAGVIPTAIGIGTGAEARRPMAIAILGGMVTSTFLTLYVVPAIYTYFDDVVPLSQRAIRQLGRLKEKFFKRSPGPKEPAGLGMKDDGAP